MDAGRDLLKDSFYLHLHQNAVKDALRNFATVAETKASNSLLSDPGSTAIRSPIPRTPSTTTTTIATFTKDEKDELFKVWAIENVEFLRKFRFYKSTPKVTVKIAAAPSGSTASTDNETEIPDFNVVDVTFLSYVAPQILPDANPVHDLRQMRNELAHGATSELTHAEMEQQFVKVVNIAKKMMKPFPDSQKDWVLRLEKLKTDPLGDLQEMESRMNGIMTNLKEDVVAKIDEFICKQEQQLLLQQQQQQVEAQNPACEEAAMERVSERVRKIIKDTYQRQYSMVNIPGAVKGFSLKDLYINVRLRFKAGGRLKEKKDLIKEILAASRSSYHETEEESKKMKNQTSVVNEAVEESLSAEMHAEEDGAEVGDINSQDMRTNEQANSVYKERGRLYSRQETHDEIGITNRSIAWLTNFDIFTIKYDDIPN